MLIGVWLEKKYGITSIEFKRYVRILPILADTLTGKIDIDTTLKRLQSINVPEVVSLFDDPLFMRELFNLKTAA